MLSLTPEMRSVLNEGRQAHVAVVTKNGPHVTPELYALARDTIWFAVASTTLKLRVLPDNPRVGALVRVGGRSVLLSGDARSYDVRSPADLARAVGDADVARAMGGYLLRNAGDLAAFARDAVVGRLGRKLPPRRVLVRLRPSRAALLDGTFVASSIGDWRGHLPEEREHNLRGDRDAVVGWLAPDGPVALPARWDGERAHVPAAAAALAALPAEAPACVVLDDYNRPGPAAKSGTLYRGTGRLGLDGTATIDAATVTSWDGVATATHDA
jgi:hypothetical protein